jgi:TPR repeat protein
MKKAKFHFEAAAMAGHEVARYNLGIWEANSGNKEQAVKHGRLMHQLGIIKLCMTC